MNIFFLHWDPRVCAKWHVDKHIVKMCLESFQLLASVHLMTGSKYVPKYKLTHKNHPCSVWARENLSNYKWLVLLANELCKEYTFRYGKVHRCERDGMIKDFFENLPPIPDKEISFPALAMPDEYKDVENPVKSYRNYYKFEKHKLHSWKKREVPKWI